MNPWDRLAAVVTGRRSWLVLLALLLASGALLGLVGANDSAGQAPTSLPATAASAPGRRQRSGTAAPPFTPSGTHASSHPCPQGGHPTRRRVQRPPGR
ncbi:hypothetical protein, partial [Nocardia farcinica]|uniref:hypothetical protein n=1 Tax=Nocardia farcinica TaxID=37329 RepID=UPI002453C65E